MKTLLNDKLAAAPLHRVQLLVVALFAVAFLLVTGLAARFLVDPPTSLVITTAEFELRLEPRGSTNAVVLPLDPGLAAPPQANRATAPSGELRTQTLLLKPPCDTLRIRAQRRAEAVAPADTGQGVVLELDAMTRRTGSDGLVDCRAGDAELQTTEDAASLSPRRTSRHVTRASPAVFARVRPGTVLSNLRVLRLEAGVVEEAKMPNAEVFADEALEGRGLVIEADDWELKRLELVSLGERPLLRASLGMAGGVTTIRLDGGDGANLVQGWRWKKWWAIFFPVFGAMTVLDVLRMEWLSRWLARALASRKPEPSQDARAGVPPTATGVGAAQDGGTCREEPSARAPRKEDVP